MIRLLSAAPCAFVLLAFAAFPLAAQVLPGPGEGAYTWATLGTQVIDTSDLVFTEAGDLISFNADLNFYDPVTETWTLIDPPNAVGGGRALLPLGADTLIVGDYLARSLDDAQTWHYPCGRGSNVTCERLSVDHSQAIYEIPRGPYAGRLLAGGALYSDDRGATWTPATVVANETNWSFAMRDFAALPSGRVVGAGEWGVGVSEDGGENWTPSTVWGPYGFNGYGIEAFATPGSVQAHDAGGAAPSCGLPDPQLCEGAVWLGTSTEAVGVRSYWTNDGGRTWTEGSPLPQIHDGPGWGLVPYLGELDRSGTASDGSSGVGRGLSVLGRGFVFATVDGGVTWHPVARVPYPPVGDGHVVLSAEVGPDGRLYVAWLSDAPVFVTSEAASLGLDAVVVSDEAAPSAEALGLSVRPNPSAGGRVTVALSQASPQEVRVEVFDAVGRRVAVLHEGAAVGDLSLDVDTSGFAVGVYRVVVTVGGERVSAAFTVAR